MTRMIERWFPCQEVSDNSVRGWGSGNAERNLFTWFAARPTAQAKAAVICSLLPWPDDESEQLRLQSLVREAMTGRYAAWSRVREELLASNPEPPSILDPFAGRGMIPLEAARLGLPAKALDYAPVAVLASRLLIEFPFKDWSGEPQLPFGQSVSHPILTEERLASDVERVAAEVARRYRSAMLNLFPEVDGRRPWAYLWSVTLPCQECGRRFPLVGSLSLQNELKASKKTGPTGIAAQSFRLIADHQADTFHAVVVEGRPETAPTLTNATDSSGRKIPGKSATCIFCDHVHPLAVHRRLANQGLGQDALLLAIDHNPLGGKSFRAPTTEEVVAAEEAKKELMAEAPFGVMLPAVPSEPIGPGNQNIIGPVIYGARTFGDLMNDRQTLGFVRLCRIISEVGDVVRRSGASDDYVRALSAYAAAVMVRRIRRSTRGATLMVYSDGRSSGMNNIYVNEGSLTFSYDYVETGLDGGSGSWEELAERLVRDIKSLRPEQPGKPAQVFHGSATEMPFATGSVDAVVTDPPYDQMIAYTDSSDLLYCWIKRALNDSWPELCVTPDEGGVQAKSDEIIVKRVRGDAPDEHRNRAHYDAGIAKAFSEMRRVVADDGLVTIVFGHGDPEVWQRLLTAMSQAGLVMTGSWPARTESGGSQGKANIETTLTMACRPAPSGRPAGRKVAVEAEVRAEVRSRVPFWERSGLAPTDMLMAAAGPAMEAVGQYSEVLDARGVPVDISTFLPLARAAVQEAMAVEIDHHPLDTFDPRTRFCLWWARLYGRQVIAKSELRWQALAASLDLEEIRDLVPDAEKGCRLVTSKKFSEEITPESSVIDVALAMAKASDAGLHAAGEVLVEAGRDIDDGYLWSAMAFLADRLPDSDPDSIAWTRLLRSRGGIGNAAKTVAETRLLEKSSRKNQGEQTVLF